MAVASIVVGGVCTYFFIEYGFWMDGACYALADSQVGSPVQTSTVEYDVYM